MRVLHAPGMGGSVKRRVCVRACLRARECVCACVLAGVCVRKNLGKWARVRVRVLVGAYDWAQRGRKRLRVQTRARVRYKSVYASRLL
eukprot:6179180-Pleurochrysis_carterae.AAC.4